jgi:SAM-dependent methyltransferase
MTNKRTIESYDNYAEKWAKRMRSGKNIAHEYLEKPAMYGALPDLKGKKVLCLGCGTGEECEYLNSLGAEVIGVDISKGLINYAKKSYPNLDFKVMDMEKLDFETETFDFVYSSLVMHYLDSWKNTLEGINKILKKDGTFLFSTHHPALWGADRTRTDDERTSLLGYKKNYKKETCEILGDYLSTKEIEDVWFNDFEVSYFHRSLESIFKDIHNSGLILNRFLEPKAIDETKIIDPVFWEIHQKIPLFMIIELRKSSSE